MSPKIPRIWQPCGWLSNVVFQAGSDASFRPQCPVRIRGLHGFVERSPLHHWSEERDRPPRQRDSHVTGPPLLRNRHLRGELDSESGAERCLAGFQISMAITTIRFKVATFGPLVPGVDENYLLVSWQVRRRPAGDYSQPMAEQIGR